MLLSELIMKGLKTLDKFPEVKSPLVETKGVLQGKGTG